MPAGEANDRSLTTRSSAQASTRSSAQASTSFVKQELPRADAATTAAVMPRTAAVLPAVMMLTAAAAATHTLVAAKSLPNLVYVLAGAGLCCSAPAGRARRPRQCAAQVLRARCHSSVSLARARQSEDDAAAPPQTISATTTSRGATPRSRRTVPGPRSLSSWRG